ncbi:hypothetical protein C5B42_01190 [Candidatus Cerribacteria bacterium 'Amazon FNV 2010 28 9']|uniref:Penicillin-binding protein 2 n=1 Tax=Candidatus Cerribacteria bacterium 'Amazon FNV 2010 28 9' TaxID=2081795 RepID=A0A317JQ66_9BACT|nr:MAG: hypothetical protein C5B42_01190 [Candidatus Cerribacteria bacterium 'Amazon FNV 2010 28 9']
MVSRLRLLSIIFLFCFGAVITRLFYWQFFRSDDLRAAALAQYQHTSAVPYTRGKIFTEDGYPLVLNQTVYTLFAEPNHLSQPASQIAALLFPFVLSSQTSTQSSSIQVQSSLVSRLSDTSRNWVALGHTISEQSKQQIQQMNIGGIGFDPEEIRFYPEGSMAAHLLGFVGNDANGEPTGYFGVEGKYNMELKGKDGEISQETDALGKPIAIGDFQEFQGLVARDLYLTIHRDVQHVLEQKIAEGVQKYGAMSGDVVVMEPQTGKIIGLASFPSYDPSHFWTADPSLYKDPIVADGYEPGSTFKVLTVAAGIDSGVITPDTPCDDCGAPKTVGKYTIRTWNDQYFKNISMNDALAKSDNTAMMFVADKVGKDRFIHYIHEFGIGEKTGIDLQDETTPPLRADNAWGDIDIATASFGQGIAVTEIQILNAVSAIANGGILMKPYVVSKVVAGDQTFVTQPQQIRHVVNQQTASEVAQMMVYSATHGDAKWALPKGYSIAGKTGTAQIPVGGHYDPNRTIASFIGFAPADNPKFVMLVRLTDPQTSEWGSETAAPIWFDIAKELFLKMGIPPTQ